VVQWREGIEKVVIASKRKAYLSPTGSVPEAGKSDPCHSQTNFRHRHLAGRTFEQVPDAVTIALRIWRIQAFWP
jgi:hypothetical protein